MEILGLSPPLLRRLIITCAVTIAFRCGQIDALARTLLLSPALFSAEMRASLGLRLLSRAWQQYREDRAITHGARLVGAECTAERDAFLALLERVLSADDALLLPAIRTVQRIAINPLAEEARQRAEIIENSVSDLDAVIEALTDPRLPEDPLERVLALVKRFRYSRGDQADGLSATAHSPCWAINLAVTARGDLFNLSERPLPFPGVAQRRLFRADLGPETQRNDAHSCLLGALRDTACDIDRQPTAARAFARAFPKQRSNSRLLTAWMVLDGLGGLTPAQLGRALPATKAGAAKLLRQLVSGGLARGQGPFEPFVSSLRIAVVYPG